MLPSVSFIIDAQKVPEHLRSYFCPIRGCGKCYVCKIRQIFQEVWRVLKPDGTCWLNLGDSYAGSWGNFGRQRIEGGESEWKEESLSWRRNAYENMTFLPPTACSYQYHIKRKNLLGIPWRVAFALQQDGWILRSDVIWSKVNPLPESVKDRPSKAHEYMFLLVKSEKYYYDSNAIREPFQEASLKTRRKASGRAKHEALGALAGGTPLGHSCGVHPAGRNKRTVWHLATQSYPGHYAVMPEKLVEPCVLASSRLGDIVLDPFVGSGTVPVVASQHGRKYLGIDLNATYVEVAKNRIERVQAQLLSRTQSPFNS